MSPAIIRVSLAGLATIVGFVAGGTLTSVTGYVITVVSPGGQPIDVQRWNGLRIKINGLRLPGDRLVARKESVVLGLCHRKFPSLQRSGSHA